MKFVCDYCHRDAKRLSTEASDELLCMGHAMEQYEDWRASTVPLTAANLAEYAPGIATCSHSWVAGMMCVDPEDLEAVAASRTVECEKCSITFRPGMVGV